jgi:outer membrane protein assembly factor BamD (BamD/ComL family)
MSSQSTVSQDSFCGTNAKNDDLNLEKRRCVWYIKRAKTMSKQTFRLFLFISFLLASFLMEGCAVLSPVGKAVASGYDNMVAYFNTYYNAKRIFDDAEEDAKIYLLAQRGNDSTQALPADLLKKFDIVVDKCSNVLVFHRSSTSVEHALLLIGKSFYYQRQYMKAEKKFIELISQYPKGSARFEAQFWYVRTLEAEKRTAEAMKAADALLAALEQDKIEELQYECRLEIGIMEQQQNQFTGAAEQFAKARSMAGSGQEEVPPLFGLGDCAAEQGDYAGAVKFYLTIPNVCNNLYDLFRSRLDAVIAERQGGMLAQSLSLTNAMIGDFRMKDYRESIYFERGRTERALHAVPAALRDFQFVDTTSGKTALTYRDSYELGSLYEKELMDYPAALKSYLKATGSSDAGIADAARQKSRALGLYLEAWQRFLKADSLMNIRWDTAGVLRSDTSLAASPDSSRRPKSRGMIVPLSDTSHAVSPDSPGRPKSRGMIVPLSDTSHAVSPDSPGRPKPRGMIVPRSDTSLAASPDSPGKPKSREKNIPLSRDSLQAVKSVSLQEIGDVLYAEMNMPDSALTYYLKAEAICRDSTQLPRILYVLSELAGVDSAKAPLSPAEYLKKIIGQYPESPYANQARRNLGMTVLEEKEDSAKVFYERGERNIDEGKYAQALANFGAVEKRYPFSPLAPQSVYAKGWVYEYRLKNYDSVAVQYQILERKYSSSYFSRLVHKRTSQENPADSVAKQDTLKTITPIRQNPVPAIQDTIRRAPRMPRPPGIIKDSLRLQRMEEKE